MPLILVAPYKLSIIAAAVGSTFGTSVYATFDDASKSAGATLYSPLNIRTSTTGSGGARANTGKSSGKWYWEITLQAGTHPMIGVGTVDTLLAAVPYNHNQAVFFYAAPGGPDPSSYNYLWTAAAHPQISTGPLPYGSVIGVALDMNAKTVQFFVNGVSFASSPLQNVTASTVIYPIVCDGGSPDATVLANFGATAFAYPVPSGYNSGIYEKRLFPTLDSVSKASDAVLSNGNLTVVTSSINGNGARSTLARATGKWYWEVNFEAGPGGLMVGVGTAASQLAAGGSYNHTQSVFLYAPGPATSNYIFRAGSATGTGAPMFGAGTVVGVAVDLDAKTIKFYVNNTLHSQSTIPNTAVGELIYPMIGDGANGPNVRATINFGATTFMYSVPTGYNNGFYGNQTLMSASDHHADVSLSADYLTATTPVPAKGWYRSVRANTSLPTTGKWAWEVTSSVLATGWNIAPISIAQATSPLDKCFNYDAINAYGFSFNAASSAATFTLLVDMDTRTMTAYRNGVLVGSTFAGNPGGAASTIFPAGVYYPGASLYSSDVFEFNFGATAFKYPGVIPANYNPLVF